MNDIQSVLLSRGQSKISDAKAITKSLQELYEMLLKEDLPKENKDAIKMLKRPVDKVLGWEWEEYSSNDEDEEREDVSKE